MALPLLKRCYFGGFTGDIQKSDWKKSIIILLKINLENTQSHTKPVAAEGWWPSWQRTHCSAEVRPWGSGCPRGIPVTPGASCPHAPALRDPRTCPRYNSRSRRDHEAPGPEAGVRSAPPARVASARPTAVSRGPEQAGCRGSTPPQPVLTNWCAGTRR